MKRFYRLARGARHRPTPLRRSRPGGGPSAASGQFLGTRVSAGCAGAVGGDPARGAPGQPRGGAVPAPRGVDPPFGLWPDGGPVPPPQLRAHQGTGRVGLLRGRAGQGVSRPSATTTAGGVAVGDPRGSARPYLRGGACQRTGTQAQPERRRASAYSVEHAGTETIATDSAGHIYLVGSNARCTKDTLMVPRTATSSTEPTDNVAGLKGACGLAVAPDASCWWFWAADTGRFGATTPDGTLDLTFGGQGRGAPGLLTTSVCVCERPALLHRRHGQPRVSGGRQRQGAEDLRATGQGHAGTGPVRQCGPHLRGGA